MDPEAAGWVDHRTARATPGSTVVGDLRVLPEVASAELGVARDVLVHLPAAALTSGRRYPVLSMHDGQNLFDAATSFVGEWRVDETLADLAVEGLELVVVGIPHSGDDRRYAEYTPYRGRGGRFPMGGLGSAYLRWVVGTVKPAVDRAFPTRPERAATGIIGSSLGGLISMWATIEHPATFGLVGSMSTAYPGGQSAILRRLRGLAPDTLPDRIYLDVGGQEGSSAPDARTARRWSAGFLGDARRTRDVFTGLGLREPDRLRYVEDLAAIHQESAWAARLPDALRFLYMPLHG
ncbi:MAG TPA: alpha/beta hydrolase-fold protein [Candidatus Limnocylindrales bacterium]